MTWAWMETSRALTGSSQIMRRGLSAMAQGYPDPLPLSPGELVRVTVVVLGVEADHLQKVLHPLLRSLPRATAHVVDLQWLGDDVAHRHAGVQTRVGILEDYLHAPPYVEHLLAVVREYVLALEDNLALRGPSRRKTRRANVLLPHPDSPTSPSVSPRRTERSTPSTALTCLTVRCRTPALMGKCIFRFFFVSSRYSPE